MDNVIPFNTDYTIQQLNLADVLYRLNYNIVDRYIIKYQKQWYGDIGGCLVALPLSKLLYIAKTNVLYNMLIDLFNCNDIDTRIVKSWITSKSITIYKITPKQITKHRVHHTIYHQGTYDVIL